MITIIAKCKAVEGGADKLKELALNLVNESRKESGNISYDFYEEIESPLKFTFIECWKDQQAIDIHNASSHFISFGEKASSLFDGALDIALYNKIS